MKVSFACWRKNRIQLKELEAWDETLQARELYLLQEPAKLDTKRKTFSAAGTRLRRGITTRYDMCKANTLSSKKTRRICSELNHV